MSLASLQLHSRAVLFVIFLMAASLSALDPTGKNCVALLSPNESSTTRARRLVTGQLLQVCCSRHSRRGQAHAEFDPVVRQLSSHRSRHVKGKLRAPLVSPPLLSTAYRSQ